MRLGSIALFAALLLAAQPLHAQMSMETHDHSSTDRFLSYLLQHGGSGTSAEPASTPLAMLMTSSGGWMFMLHGLAFATDQQQSGPRGYDKFFSTNWIMGMASRRLGQGQLTLRAMFSLEPATITGRRYPLLLQTGETAFGNPIVDAQHPHNFFMEIAALYDRKLGDHTLLSFYAAPMGDPAIGPTAFPHRASAADDPIAPLGHHLEDSTHIAADVLTAGLAYRFVRLEGSAFHGREPNENRWAIQSGALDSYSWRLTASPAPDWSGQFSWAHIHSPEALQPQEDQIRMTASVMYNRKLSSGNWANTILWGRTRGVGGSNVLNGYLLESTLDRAPNHFWTRVENVDRSDDLLLGGVPQPPGFAERFLARVQAFSFGYGHNLPSPAWLTTMLGAQWTLYRTPDSLRPIYGAHPQGVAAFLRFRLGE
ncbi:MAG: hypothetical protein EPN33_14460 [Acidobacteria bacterium]|nr:MAG: hypothetical protein EPN33_14460 [Acidobacteriota bacterium]